MAINSNNNDSNNSSQVHKKSKIKDESYHNKPEENLTHLTHDLYRGAWDGTPETMVSQAPLGTSPEL